MLDEKVIVITGGAGLIGRHFCEAVAANGGIPIVADRQLDIAKEVAENIISRYGVEAQAISVDITNKDSIINLIFMLQQRFGKIDALVNNAYPRNANYGKQFEDVTYEDFCENISLHIGGYFLTSQQFGSMFRKQGYGNIVNMSSVYGVVAPRFDVYADTNITMPVEYAAIKAAVINLTRYMASYFKGSGVRVNSLSPGGILDKQPDAFISAYRRYCSDKGMLEPKDIVPALIFLLSDGARYVNGQNLLVDDGFTL